jgi:hypothetical protein
VTVLQEVGPVLEQRLSHGPADLNTGNPDSVSAALKKGQVVAGTVTPFMSADLGVSVRAGAPKPDISSVEDTKILYWRPSRSAIRVAAAASTSRKESHSSA